MLFQQLFDLSWECVLLNNLSAWREHTDFYSGLSIIINQTCDFGQIIWHLLHLRFLICLLGQLSSPCLIHGIFVRIKQSGICKGVQEVVKRELIARWYLYYVLHVFFLPWFTLLVVCSGFLS